MVWNWLDLTARRPSDRPSAQSLLEHLPAKFEDTSIKQVEDLMNHKGSATHRKLMQVLFAVV